MTKEQIAWEREFWRKSWEYGDEIRAFKENLGLVLELKHEVWIGKLREFNKNRRAASGVSSNNITGGS